MSSRLGTGGIPILVTMVKRKVEGGVKSDALRLAWADWLAMQAADGPPLQLGIIEKNEAVEMGREQALRRRQRCGALGTGCGFSERLFGRRNSAVMLTPHQPARQWVAVLVRSGQSTARLSSTRGSRKRRVCCSLDWTRRKDGDGKKEGGRNGQSREAARSLAKDVMMRDQSGSKAKAKANIRQSCCGCCAGARCKAQASCKRLSAGFCLVQPPFWPFWGPPLCLLARLMHSARDHCCC